MEFTNQFDMHSSKGLFIKISSAILAVFLTVLGYGYWHAHTHGSLYVWLDDVSDRTHSLPIKNAEIIFLDSAGREIARGKSDSVYGTVYISSPGSYSCWEEEKDAPFSTQARAAWGDCFERQSRWLISWIRKVNYAELKVGDSQWHNLPVTVSEYKGDWWLWWVPLRHVGGKPYTNYYIHLSVKLGN